MRYCRLFFLFYVFLCCTVQALAAWQPLTRHITMADGLPSNVLYDVYEDSKGFIWFCTDQGISRYDGSAFQNYSIKDGIPDMEIFRIREDKQQRYWLICYNRKACYLKYGKVYTSENDTLCRKIEAMGINYDELFTDRNGNDCLAGRKIGILGRKPSDLHLLSGITLLSGRPIHFRRNGVDYVVVSNILYNINTGFCQKLPVNYCDVSFYDGRMLFFPNNEPLEWRTGLSEWQFDKGRFSWLKMYAVPSRIYQIGLSETGALQLCTAGGMLIYDSLSGKFIPDTTFPAGIATNCMRIDREGNRWLSTLNNGVYLVPVNGGRIIDRRSGLAENNILSIALGREGDVLAGDGFGHVYRIKKDNTIQTYTLAASQYINRVLFLRDNGRGLLMAGSDAGLYTIEHNGVTALCAGEAMKTGIFSGHYFYAGSSHGLAIYDTNNRGSSSMWTGRITAMVMDGNHTLWAGGIQGLCYYVNGRRIQYEGDRQLRDCFITCMVQLPGGGILAGSSTRGLFLIKDYRQPPVHLDGQKGLSGNSCKRLFVAENGCIWLSSDGGIDRIRLLPDGRFTIKPFPLPQGVAGKQINDLAESDGKLYLATANGILILNSLDTLQSRPPRLYIEAINGKALTEQRLRFPYKERNLHISYTGVSYTGVAPLQYKYLLTGGTDDTLYTNAQAIDFSALSPGDYSLLLWCRSPGSQWTAKPLQLSFTILPPLWRHPVLIGVYFLFAGSIVVLLFRFRVNKVKQRAAQETRNQQQLAELELNALRAQINPHFIFNALNAIQFYYSQNDEIAANDYMTSFAHFIRLTLAHSQAHWLPLSEEIAMLRTYLELEQLRFRQSFTVVFDVAPGISAEQIGIPAMLIQPYVENAINHGLRYLIERQGKLTLSFMLKQDNLCCIIDDNGVGRSQAAAYRQAQHTSMGMKINHQRIETINRMYGITVLVEITDKRDTLNETGGTRVSLLIPLKLTTHDPDYANC